MTATAPEVDPVDQQAVDRADAQARALEAAIAAAVVAALAARVAGIVEDLRDAWTRWGAGDAGAWATARFYLAARLRAVPVRVAEVVAPTLTRAAELGARQVGAPLPAGYDPTVREHVMVSLERIDTTIRDRLTDTARRVETGRITTDRQFTEVLARVEGIPAAARARVEDTVARTVADGAHAAVYGAGGREGAGLGSGGDRGEPARPAPTPDRGRDAGGDRPAPAPAPEPTPAADTTPEPQPVTEAEEPPDTPQAASAPLGLVWRSERGSCLACASLAGSLPGDDGLYRPTMEVGKVSPYIAAGVLPPAHPACRCRLVPATPGLADALRREAEREVAYGWSQYDSLRSRLRAADLLASGGGARLPKTVVRRAREAVQRGEFRQVLPPPPR